MIHQAQLTIAQTKWDTGITAVMNQGNYDMVDFYEEILIELSTFYPKGHFNNQTPKNYFSELISSRFIYIELILHLCKKKIHTHSTAHISGSIMPDLVKIV